MTTIATFLHTPVPPIVADLFWVVVAFAILTTVATGAKYLASKARSR